MRNSQEIIKDAKVWLLGSQCQFHQEEFLSNCTCV